MFPFENANLFLNKYATENPLCQKFTRNKELLRRHFTKVHEFKEFLSAFKNVN